ncbi:thiamine ABC transporter substrate binding subunit [Candidatus Profftia tarda]|uniref:Thiamine-binding periplasmic protein n=1 Tax=Candidatus Profftia tarda TaxID=1177216 RepID=A0A8E4GIB2_9ENTR|nr:thiamine ABC transporter substrate binding subunit [Candidatus Profftia tarda]CAD6511718.1 Thiamine-binding periplasmic protein [Candidatus Profftia tarda]
MLKLIIAALMIISTSFRSNGSSKKPVLTVYTCNSFAAQWGPGPKIKEFFEKKYDCEIKFITLEYGISLLNRIRMEGKKSSADIVLGLDNNILKSAKQSGLFVPHGIDTKEIIIPHYSPDIFFMPYDYGYFAFIYNKNMLKNPPTSLKQLIESPARLWRLIYQDPRTSSMGLGLILWMQKVYGDQASRAWTQLAKHTLTITKGWSESYGLFLKGESDLVLSYTTSPAYHIIEEKQYNYAAADFSEGHYMQVEFAAQLASSKHPNLAHKFMQFIITADFQNQIPTGNWMYPVIANILPEGFKQINTPRKALEFNQEYVANNRAQWIHTWQTSVSR